MNKATILIISENNHRTTNLVESFGNRFYSLVANSEETAITRFLQSPVDAVVFGNDVIESTKTTLSKIFSTQQADVVFIDDNDAIDMAEKISNNITAQKKENKPAFSFKDDALKNAGLNIEIQ